MRLLYLIILLFACIVWTSSAQTNASTNAMEAILALVTTNAPPPPTNPPAASSPLDAFKTVHGPIYINSDGAADFNLNGRLATFRDNVRVSDPQMTMTCEWLESDLPLQSNEHVTNIVAETNVVINFTDDKGQKTRATGQKAVYYFHVQDGVTNETITLTGDLPDHPPTAEQGGFTSWGDTIIWNRATGHITYTGKFGGHYLTDTNTPTATNSLAMGTNEMTMTTNAPDIGTNAPAVTTTNQPPATK
jgi:hypothetical protein